MVSELGGDVGSFAAGAASNKAAEKYMNEMVYESARRTQFANLSTNCS